MKRNLLNSPVDFVPGDWREGRRLRAWQLKQEGWKQKDIARALGVSDGAVSQWLKRAREQGVPSLRRRPVEHPKCKLSSEQLARIPELLLRGAESYGFRGDVWTTRRIAEVIWREFGVRYHRGHISRLLASAGWSVQKPEKRATQRKEAAIEAWFLTRWPALKKKRG